jgi:hypothetical protein
MAGTRRTTGAGGNVTKLPTKVHYSVLADEEEPLEAFVAEIREDYTIELTDPTELQVGTIAELREPLAFLRLTTQSEEDRQELKKLSSKKFGNLMRAYFAHFGIDAEPGKSNGLGF